MVLSGAVERLKAIAPGGGGADEKRYHTEGTASKPDEVSDPHTWKDESKTGLIQKAKNRPRTTVTYIAIIFVLFGIFLAYSTTYAPGLYESPLVRGIAKFGAVAVISGLIAGHIVKGNIVQVDWLVLFMPKKGLRVYIGEFETDHQGNPMFAVRKGFGILGTPGDYFTKGDMSNEWARVWAKRGAKASEPARIRLYESMGEVANTDYGTIVGQLCDEIVEDELGRDSDLVAEPPDIADKEKMAQLKEELKRKVAQLNNVKSERDLFKDQRDEYKRQANRSREEILDEYHNRHKEILEVFPSLSVESHRSGVTPEPDLSEMESNVQDQTNNED